ncbi:hypothetical protein MMC15_004769 [Xylographa vitiligo]|nr:hypothetical protein [Xylographa vitiligo]
MWPESEAALDWHEPNPSEFGGYAILLLQMMETVPAVRHSVVAVAAAYEAYTAVLSASVNLPPQNGRLLLKHYNEAIRQIGLDAQRSPLDRQHITVTLMTSTMFIVVDIMQGAEARAVAHCTSGIRILLDHHARASPNGDIAFPQNGSMETMYRRLDLHLAAFPGYGASLFAMTSAALVPHAFGPFPNGPLYFPSHKAAQDAFFNLLTALYNGSAGARLAHLDPHTRTALAFRLSQWTTAFTQLQARQAPLAGLERRTALLLAVHAKMLHIRLATPAGAPQTSYDAFEADFAALLPSLGELVALAVRRAERVNFTSRPAVGQVLFYLALKCRAPRIRREAVFLLENGAGRQGIWDGMVLGRVCRRVVQLEEGEGGVMTAGDVVEMRRVRRVQLELRSARREVGLRYMVIEGKGWMQREEALRW